MRVAVDVSPRVLKAPHKAQRLRKEREIGGELASVVAVVYHS